MIYIVIISSLIIYLYYLIKKNKYILDKTNNVLDQNNNVLEQNNNVLSKNNNLLNENILTIDVSNINDNAFKYMYFNCVNNGIPLKIKNGIKYFPKIKKWTNKYIKDNYSNENEKVSFTEESIVFLVNNIFGNTSLDVYKQEYKLNKNDYNDSSILVDTVPQLYLDKNYLKQTRYNPTKYLCRREIVKNDIRIEKDILPNILFTKNTIASFMFINGPKDTGVLPHNHSHAINILKEGKKKWIFEVNESSKLSLSVRELISIINKKNNDKDDKYISLKWMDWYKYYNKKYNKLACIECVQEPNDVIYVPHKIPHTVYNLEETIGVVIDLKEDNIYNI